jgi:hypothetical protein
MRCAKCGSDNGQGNLTLFFYQQRGKGEKMDKAKWDAAAKAVAQNPTLSNKALSRSAGVSDHLIAKVRRGMTVPKVQPYTCALCGAQYLAPSEHEVCPKASNAARRGAAGR